MIAIALRGQAAALAEDVELLGRTPDFAPWLGTVINVLAGPASSQGWSSTMAPPDTFVAVSGSQASAPIIIETGEAVVTMGGFSGSDNAPTVSQLETMVVDGYEGLYELTV